MKFNYTEGCICTSLTINGKETIDINIIDFQKALQKAFIAKRNKLINFKDYVKEIIMGAKYREHFHEISNDDGDLWIYESKINNTRYKYVEICYEDFIFIDDKLWDGNEITDKIFDDVISLISQIKDITILQTLFCLLTVSLGKYTCSDKPCDCCGDFIREYDLKI